MTLAHIPGGVLAAVLLSALLHASWNALVKSGKDTFLTTALVAGGAALIAALALPFVPAPKAASWPFIAASSASQLLYYALLVATYRKGSISHAYPLMRGCAPLLVALGSAAIIGEHLSAAQWLALACICAGILALSSSARRDAPGTGRTTAYALLTACVIAAYTLIDGVGVRLSGAPPAYTMWIFLLTGVGFCGAVRLRRPGQLRPHALANARIVALGGAGTLGSYGIVLWAMTQAPVAAIAALRETSILFATAIAALVLRERISARRYGAIALVALGAVLMRLA